VIRQVMPWRAMGPGDLTILRAPGRRLTKLITESDVVGYDRAAVFEPTAFRFETVEDLANLLDDLAGQTDACIIRGTLKREHAGRRLVLRRYRDRQDVPAPFEPAARQWLMIEIDDLPAPAGVDPADPVLAGAAARMALPAPFWSARAAVQLSSSAGIKPGIRLHLWFWLDRPVADAEAKRWLKDAPVDLAIYQPVGIHYVASPVLAGVDDPCCDGRLAVLPGYPEVAVPALPDRPARQAFIPVDPRPYAAPKRGLSFKATRPEAYMLACLRAVAGATPGNRHPTIVRVAARLFGLAKAGDLDPADVAGRIKGAVALSTFDRDPDEVDQALRWAWEAADPWRLPR
jgi:hypothetical protein